MFIKLRGRKANLYTKAQNTYTIEGKIFIEEVALT
jgi:hypothetical protein